MNLFYAAILVFLFNIPFGYWRAMEKKFSWQWFVSIHVPIPFVVLVRYQFNLGFALYTYPIMVLAFFSGQFLGKILNKQFSKKIDVSKNIFKDLVVLIK
jgi:hypothetical protein